MRVRSTRITGTWRGLVTAATQVIATIPWRSAIDVVATVPGASNVCAGKPCALVARTQHARWIVATGTLPAAGVAACVLRVRDVGADMFDLITGPVAGAWSPPGDTPEIFVDWIAWGDQSSGVVVP